LQVENSVFTGAMHGLKCETTPRRILWRNVLKSGAGSAVVVAETQSSGSVKFSLDRVTLRNSGPLLTCAGPLVEVASAAGIEVESAACVFEVTGLASLIKLIGPQVRPDWPEAVRLSGDGSLIRPGTILLATADPQADSSSPLESDELQFEGLFIDDFAFAGKNPASTLDSVLATTHAPRRQQDELPGIDGQQLPQ
jgi:hypothetical protein